jgi:RNA polymerase sigma factor (sigma-70 family)
MSTNVSSGSSVFRQWPYEDAARKANDWVMWRWGTAAGPFETLVDSSEGYAIALDYAWAARSTYAGSGSPQKWAFTCAASAEAYWARREHKLRARTPRESDCATGLDVCDIETSGERVDDMALGNIEAERLLARLTEHQRHVVLLARDGLAQVEIAKKLGVSPSAVCQTLSLISAGLLDVSSI